MSDRAVQSYEESDGMAGNSMYPYQSVWMAHWMQTSYRSATQGSNSPSPLRVIKEEHHLLDQLESASTIFESSEELKQVPEVRAAIISGSKRLNCHPFPIFSLSKNRKIISALETGPTAICQTQDKSQADLDTGNDTIASGRNECHLPSVLARPPTKTKSLSGDCQLQFAGISENPDGQQVKSLDFFEKNSAFSRSFKGDFVGSTSNTVPYKFNGRITPLQSLMCGQELNLSSSVVASREHCNYQSYCEFLVHDKKIDNCLNLQKKEKQLVKENGRSMPSHDSSLSNDQFQVFVGDQKIHSYFNVGSLPSKSNPQITNSEKRKHCSYSWQGTPFSIHNVDSMGLNAALDSMEGLPVAPPNVPQTTHRFLIDKNSDVNLCGGGQTFSGSSTRLKGNIFLGFSPNFDSHRHKGMTLLPPGSSKDNEGNGTVAKAKSTPAVVNLWNESSAETDTMDVSAYQDENNCTGEVSSATCKNLFRVEPAPPSQAAKIVEMGPKDAPYVDRGLPAVPTGPSSLDEREPSASTTQSLGVEHLSHSEKPSGSKSSPCPDSAKESDPNSRWVKRLKMSVTDSMGHGTKSSRIGEVLFPEKVNKFFRKIIKCNRTDSDSKQGEQNDVKPTVSRKAEPAFMDSKKKVGDVMLSHSWIQRWCANRSPLFQKKHRTLIFEPRRSKRVSELTGNQYPSVAAMALMGKAKTGFRRCEFKNRGAFVVWDTEECL